MRHGHMNVKFIYAVYLQSVEYIWYLCDRNKGEWAQFFNILMCTEWWNDLWNFWISKLRLLFFMCEGLPHGSDCVSQHEIGFLVLGLS
jgi:hypothetical protein